MRDRVVTLQGALTAYQDARDVASRSCRLHGVGSKEWRMAALELWLTRQDLAYCALHEVPKLLAQGREQQGG